MTRHFFSRKMTFSSLCGLAAWVALPMTVHGQSANEAPASSALVAPEGAPPPAPPPSVETAAQTPAAPPADLGLNEDALASELNSALSQQIVSGASRTAETSEQAPVAATVIRAEDLRRYGIRTVAEAVSFLAMGTFLLGNQITGYQTVGARGVVADGDSNNHFLVVVDGHPINQTITDGAAVGYGLGIPISMIDSIEVILGPGSVVYGGNAMLGVISIRTKPARQMQGLRLLGQAGISPAQDANGKVQNFNAGGMGVSHRVEGTFGKSFQWLNQEGEFTMGVLGAKLVLPDTAINPQTPFVNAPKTAPRFGGTMSMPLDQSVGGYGRLKVGQLAVDASYVEGKWARIGYFDYQLLRSNAVYNFDLGAHLSGFVGFRFIDYIHTSHRVSAVGACPLGGTPGSRCFSSSSAGGTQESLEVQGTYDFLADGRYQLMLGLDGRTARVKGYAFTEEAATGLRFAPDGGYKNSTQILGAYTQFRGRPVPWLAVNAGIRSDWIWERGSSAVLPSSNPAVYGPNVDTNNSAISPRAAVMLFPTDSTTLFASYSRAFRAPSANELHLVGTSIEPSTNLKPETVDSGEVGVKQKLGVHRVLASAFVEKRSGLIGFTPATTPGKLKYSGVGDIKNFGFNLGFEGSLNGNRFHYGGSFTYAYARRSISPVTQNLSPAAKATADAAMSESKTKTELLGAPEISGNLRMAYDFQGNLPEIGLAAVILGPRLTGFGYSGVLVIPPASEGASPTTSTVFGRVWRSNIDPFKTDTMVEMRLNVGGPVPYMKALRYTLMANYLFSPAFDPTAFGPTPGGATPTTAAVNNPYFPQSPGQLSPVPRLTLAAALEVNFD